MALGAMEGASMYSPGAIGPIRGVRCLFCVRGFISDGGVGGQLFSPSLMERYAYLQGRISLGRGRRSALDVEIKLKEMPESGLECLREGTR